MKRWGLFFLLIALLLLAFFASACINRVLSTVQVKVFFDGLPITRQATVVLTGLATLTTNELGESEWTGRLSKGVEIECIVLWEDPWQIRYEGRKTLSIPSGSTVSARIDTLLVPVASPLWHLTVLSLDKDNFALPERFDLPASVEGVEISYITVDSQQVYAFIGENQNWRSVWDQQFSSRIDALSSGLLKVDRIFPAQRKALILVDKKHGWRIASRTDFEDYPIDFFFEQTLSTLEAKRMLEDRHYDLLISLGAYSTLLETLYELQDHFDHYIGIESGAVEEGFFFTGDIINALFVNPGLSIEAYGQQVMDHMGTLLSSYNGSLIENHKGASLSWIRASEIQSLLARFQSLITHLELMVASRDENLRNAIKGDLVHTMSWQTLCFDFPDYKDLRSWASKIKGVLDGSIASNGYAVYSSAQGYSYLGNTLAQQAIELCEDLIEAIDPIHQRTIWVGYDEPLWEDGKKLAHKRFSQSGGISFWYPVSVRGGLWNVFDKEPYNLLSLTEDTRWLPFLKRLLLYDILPSPQWMILDKEGQVVSPQTIDPRSWEDGSVATLFIGFLDRSAIDQVWIQIGDHYYPPTDPKIQYFEDKSTLRFYFPLTSLENTLKEVGYRVLLQGADLADEGTSAYIPPIVQPEKIIIYDADNNPLLDAQPGSKVLIGPEHKVRFRVWVPHIASLDEMEVVVLLEGEDGVIARTPGMTVLGHYQGLVLMESPIMDSQVLGKSQVWETALCIYQDGKRILSENPQRSANWLIQLTSD